MAKKYYLKEIVMLGLVAWVIAINIKLDNVTSKVEILKVQIDALGFDLKSINLVVETMQEEKDDFNNLDFSEAFKVMYDKHGQHHLFEWRGRVYTTDLNEPRNITIIEKEEGASNGRQ